MEESIKEFKNLGMELVIAQAEYFAKLKEILEQKRDELSAEDMVELLNKISNIFYGSNDLFVEHFEDIIAEIEDFDLRSDY